MLLPTRLLYRRGDSHKGDFGHIFILGGCARFSGAAVLCAQATMRSGAGLVTLGIPESINNSLIKIKPKEVMTHPLPETKEATLSLSGYKKIKDFSRQIDVLVIGPGLSQNKSTQSLIRKIIANTNKPLVIDADGINALVGHLDVLRKPRTDGSTALTIGTERSRSAENREPILTPHPGEMARLINKRVSQIQKDRKELARKFVRDYKITLVLKGNNTVVADYKGNLYVNKTGNAGMATAGSGDVLTGIIGAFLGQGLGAFEAAKFAVYLHGLAGDLAAKRKTQPGMIASDIIEYIPEAIKKCS